MEGIMKRSKEEQVASWASTISGAIFIFSVWLILALMMYVLSPEIRLFVVETFGLGGPEMAVSTTMLALIIALLMVLHWKILPKMVELYPTRSEVSMHVAMCELFDTDKVDEEGRGRILEAARVVTKRRKCLALELMLITIAVMVATKVLFPMSTVPAKMPEDIYYSADHTEILLSDLGPIALINENVAGLYEQDYSLRICEALDCYGPFDYAGDERQMKILVSGHKAVEYQQSERQSESLWQQKLLIITINRYDDGDWMIVRQFDFDSLPIGLNDPDEAFDVVLGSLDAISYAKHTFTIATDEAGKLSYLQQATGNTLVWDKTKAGFVIQGLAAE